MPRTPSTEPTYRRRRQWSIAITLGLVLLLVFVVGYVYFQREILGTRDYEGEGNGKVVLVRVEDGDTVDGLVPQLLDDNVVGSRTAMINAAEDYEKSGDSRGIEAGYYALQQKMSASSAMTALTDDNRRLGVVDVSNGLPLDDVTVVGGETRTGILSMIADNSCRAGLTDGLEDCVSVDDLHAAIADTDPAQLGVPDWATQQVNDRGNDPRRIEGLISPGVHLFDPTAGAPEILRQLIESSVEDYEGTGLTQAAGTVGLSPYDMLTAASLVEREAPAGDFDKVARVILNRLNEGQQLQFDSTVNYGLDSQEIATTDDDRHRVTPWNTYAMDGLPKTPIASPGIDAVKAVENPAEGDWLYFVTVDKEGTTVFNRDFDAHEKAIDESRANGVLDSNR
jgi:UPF0755 protein